MLCNVQQSRFGAVRKMLVVPVVLVVGLAISCSKRAPASASVLDGRDQVKIAKEKLDLSVRKQVMDEVAKEIKQREAAAANAHMTPQEYKLLIEKKTLEAEKGLH